MSVAALTDFDRELLHGRNYAHVVTLHPDGRPHVTVTWIDERDGAVLVNTAAGRVKVNNVRHDPRVAVSVYDQADPYRAISIEGEVREIVEGEEAERHIDALNRRYHDDEPWQYRPDQRRVLFLIEPRRVIRRG